MSKIILALVLRMLKVVVGTSKSFRHLLACSIQGLKVLLQHVDGVVKRPSANLRVRSCQFRLYWCKKSGKFAGDCYLQFTLSVDDLL